MNMKIIAVSIFLASLPAYAATPSRVTIAAEAVGFPEGTIGEVELATQYRVIEPPWAPKENRGHFVAVTDAMATFVAPAAERHSWKFGIPQAGKKHPQEKFAFTLPSKLPAPHSGASALVSISAKFRILIPGKPGFFELEQDYPVRIDSSTSSDLTRCLRIERMADRKALRIGILSDCSKTFEELNAVPIPQPSNKKP